MLVSVKINIILEFSVCAIQSWNPQVQWGVCETSLSPDGRSQLFSVWSKTEGNSIFDVVHYRSFHVHVFRYYSALFAPFYFFPKIHLIFFH